MQITSFSHWLFWINAQGMLERILNILCHILRQITKCLVAGHKIVFSPPNFISGDKQDETADLGWDHYTLMIILNN